MLATLMAVHGLVLPLAAAQDPADSVAWTRFVRRETNLPFELEFDARGLTLLGAERWYFRTPRRLEDRNGDGADELLLSSARSMFCGHDIPFGYIRVISVPTATALAHEGGSAEFDARPTSFGWWMH